MAQRLELLGSVEVIPNQSMPKKLEVLSLIVPNKCPPDCIKPFLIMAYPIMSQDGSKGTTDIWTIHGQKAVPQLTWVFNHRGRINITEKTYGIPLVMSESGSTLTTNNSRLTWNYTLIINNSAGSEMQLFGWEELPRDVRSIYDNAKKSFEHGEKQTKKEKKKNPQISKTTIPSAPSLSNLGTKLT